MCYRAFAKLAFILAKQLLSVQLQKRRMGETNFDIIAFAAIKSLWIVLHQ